MKSPMQELLYQLRKERIDSKMPTEWRRCFMAIESIIQNNYIPEEKKKFATAWQNGFETGNHIANTSGGWNGDGEDYYDQTFNENHIGEVNEMMETKMEHKLYTEEQVNELRRALRDIAKWDESLEDDWEDAGNRATDALKSFKNVNPILLSSDEDIIYKCFQQDSYELATDGNSALKIYSDGYKAALEQIFNQKK